MSGKVGRGVRFNSWLWLSHDRVKLTGGQEDGLEVLTKAEVIQKTVRAAGRKLLSKSVFNGERGIKGFRLCPLTKYISDTTSIGWQG